VGNRQWVSDNGATASYTANSDNGYTSVGGVSTETDLNGNMVSVPGAAYAYDAQNRLVSATVNGVRTEFTYDSRNRVVQRVSKRSVGGRGLPSVSTLNLTYSGWNLIEERNAWGQLEQVYAHGAGIDELLLKITTGPAAYYHHDGLGSTIALTGENGELLESYLYDAFGAASVYDSSASALPASPRGNRFLFTGREWLSQVGLYDYRNRVYSAQIGRFLQTDPIRFSAGDGNIYRYVANNPIKFIDPMGLCQSYGDLNLTLITPLGIGITGGLFFNATGVNPYLGLAIGSPGPSASFTAASGAISAGQTSSQIQASAIFTVSSGASGGSNQNGTGPGSTPFTEVGFGSPGISYSTYYTW
jgi:RHS repeat-associated protein